MRRRFWYWVDDLSHRLPWIPLWLQCWVCDRYDKSIGLGTQKERFSQSGLLTKDVLKEERWK